MSPTTVHPHNITPVKRVGLHGLIAVVYNYIKVVQTDRGMIVCLTVGFFFVDVFLAKTPYFQIIWGPLE